MNNTDQRVLRAILRSIDIVSSEDSDVKLLLRHIAKLSALAAVDYIENDNMRLNALNNIEKIK